jgi:hypothetical protein
MKSSILFFICLIFLNQLANAQTIFAPQGAVWNYEFNFDGDGSNYRYEVEKDTIYKGKMCSKVIGQRKKPSSTQNLSPFYFYTSMDTVFFYHDSLKIFTPLYIFNVKVGDTLTLFPPKKYATSPSVAKFLITKLDTTIIDGIALRSVYTKQIDLYYNLPKYTERIGGYNVANIIAIDAIKTAMHYEVIRCYQDKEISEKFVSDKWDCDYVPTSIDEQKITNDIDIHPNPAYQLININIKNFKGKSEVYIVSTEGKLCIKKEIYNPKNQLDISFLANGVYILQIKNPNETFSKLITVIN